MNEILTVAEKQKLDFECFSSAVQKSQRAIERLTRRINAMKREMFQNGRKRKKGGIRPSLHSVQKMKKRIDVLKASLCLEEMVKKELEYAETETRTKNVD